MDEDGEVNPMDEEDFELLNNCLPMNAVLSMVSTSEFPAAYINQPVSRHSTRHSGADT
jgi:hypothetical protein